MLLQNDVKETLRRRFVGSIGNNLYAYGSSADVDRFLGDITVINEEGTFFSLNHLVQLPRDSYEEAPAGTRYGTCRIECKDVTCVPLEFYFESHDSVHEMIAHIAAMYPSLVFGHRFMHESDGPEFSGWQAFKDGERQAWEATTDVGLDDVEYFLSFEADTCSRVEMLQKQLLHQLAAARTRLCYEKAAQSGLEKTYFKAIGSLVAAEAQPEYGRVRMACQDAVLAGHDIDMRVCFDDLCMTG
jgi:hypothetical protein